MYLVAASREEIVAQKPAVTYLWKAAYFDPAADTGGGNGVPLNDVVKQHPERFFTAVLTPKEQFE